MRFKSILFAAAALAVMAPSAGAQQVRGTPSWRPAQVTVGTAATQVVGNNPNRARVLIITIGTNQVTCGPDNTVTATTGVPIAPVAYSNISLDTLAQVWCIAAANQVVAVVETF